MNYDFILDCSVTMSWLFEDEITTATAEVLQRLELETAVVPALWFLEVTNVLALAEHKGRVTPAESDDFVVQLLTLDVCVDAESSQRAFSRLLPLCRTHQLTSYDALYLDMAVRRKLPLATLDEPLRKAAQKVGVSLLGK